ncbi:P-loop containing nucleoside triphosphate hydrolase protein [Abortiporus biennis]|nr:P-loop containing nucleoside triphosphate hydrolase protein [Abortiporus biennis]
MDDDLVLNIATNVDSGPSKNGGSKKGGRWTDRVKAKRVAKRKSRPEEPRSTTAIPISDSRPVKRVRREPDGPSEGVDFEDRTIPEKSISSSSRPHTQVISSLFSSNPKIETPHTDSTTRPLNLHPSNAPLADSSTFAGLGLDPLIVTHLQTKMNILKPTSIQRATLPALLSASDDNALRDVFIQSQTGSGKTLSFLLPIIQDLLPLSTHSYIDRSIGTLAIIIAPTRELAKQISDVLEALLQLRLRPADASPDDPDTGLRLTRWLVSGLLTGGATRSHEKARLRKGVPILVSTPGRLLDHLQNTSSFNVGKCRWLVMDEADRLMELGFEETISGILKGLEGRRNLAIQAVDEGKSMEVGGWNWDQKRRTILCSATIREDVQKLAGTTLVNPIVIKAMQDDAPLQSATNGINNLTVSTVTKFTPPSQLAQKYVVVPLKLRLVTLIALLRLLLAQSHGRRGTKIIVFLDCTDSVDFHWRLLGGVSMGEDNENEDESESQSSDEDGTEKPKKSVPEKVALKSPLLPDASIYRLHGSLPLQTRLASLRGFSSVPNEKNNDSLSSILLCTSVASRGLDLPLVRAVVQYDLPTESGATEYVHRVGRTARVGKGGEAWSFVAPTEVEWAKWVVEKMQGGVGTEHDSDFKKVNLDAVGMDSVLQNGFGGKGKEFEERATEVQLSVERWVLSSKENIERARKAYLSHMRAYATHPSDEKHIFHIKHLHLGHLAKAFALREAPSAVTNANARAKKIKTKDDHNPRNKVPKSDKNAAQKAKRREWNNDEEILDAEKRMEKVVREQGRLTKKGGKMLNSTGVSEFQIAGGYALEKLVGSRT